MSHPAFPTARVRARLAPAARRAAALGLILLLAPVRAQMAMPMPAARPAPAVQAAPLNLTVRGARVVAVPPGITDTSVFLILGNPGQGPVVLTSARSPVAAHAMLMRTVTDARGLTGMQATPTLTVPARSTVTLDDTGPHVMLMGLRRALKPGEVVPVLLADAAGRTVTVRATVRKP